MSNAAAFSTAEYHAILRNDFTTFIERSFSELNPQALFQHGRYIELIAAKLEQCRTGETKRLIINLPPRTLKSHAASVAFPAWLLGHHPTTQIICASYGQDLADKHARDCRTLMSSGFYRSLFPQTAISEARNSVGDFMTTAQGGRMATSVGGVLTGRGADVIILDDMLKVVIEDKASGTSLIQELKNGGLRGIEAYQHAPGSDKLMRTAGQSMNFESGDALLPAEAPWLDDYVRELTGFPGTKFDDQVDSPTQALEFMLSKLCRRTIFDVVG